MNVLLFSSVRPEIRFQSIWSLFSDPAPVWFQPNNDRIDRIWLGPEKKTLNLDVGFEIM